MSETYIWIAFGLICLALAVPALGFVLGVIWHLRVIARQDQRWRNKYHRLARALSDSGHNTAISGNTPKHKFRASAQAFGACDTCGMPEQNEVHHD